MNVLKKSLLLLITLTFMMHAIGDVIDLGDGSKIHTSNSKVKYGPSYGWNANGTTKSNLEHLKKRSKELRAAKKKLQRKKNKLSRKKHKEERARIQKDIDKISEEFKKLFKDRDFERKISSSSRKPKKKQQARIWKRTQRQKRYADLQAKQREHEKKQAKNKAKAKKVSMLENLGDLNVGSVMTDIMASHNEVIENEDTVGDIADELKHEDCEEVTEDNVEICYELNASMSEATAVLQDSKSKFTELSHILPPLLLGGGMYVIYDELTEAQDSYKELLDTKRKLINCVEYCEIIEAQVDEMKEAIVEAEELQKNALDEIQDEVEKQELDGMEVELDVIVPNYLSKNTDVPFGHKKQLPVAFGINTEMPNAVKSAYLQINGETVPLVYYSEAGVVAGNYQVKNPKQEFAGEVSIETVDGQVFTKTITGSIHTLKPEVNIESVPGSMFKKGKFKVYIDGEFDRIEVSGTNVAPQTLEFSEVKTKHKMTVKALSKGPASVKVVATRTTKTIELPEFDGELLSTDLEGNILRENDYFQPMNLEKGQGNLKEMGLCCEDIDTDLGLCEGCHWGKRSKGSCLRLKKLGFKINAFLRASDNKCIKL